MSYVTDLFLEYCIILAATALVALLGAFLYCYCSQGENNNENNLDEQYNLYAKTHYIKGQNKNWSIARENISKKRASESTGKNETSISWSLKGISSTFSAVRYLPASLDSIDDKLSSLNDQKPTNDRSKQSSLLNNDSNLKQPASLSRNETTIQNKEEFKIRNKSFIIGISTKANKLKMKNSQKKKKKKLKNKKYNDGPKRIRDSNLKQAKLLAKNELK